jgi:hypothetical protein
MGAENAQRINGISLAILISVATALAYGYFLDVNYRDYERRVELHAAILDGSAPAPYRYRVLVPVACEAISRALAPVTGERWSFLLAYGIYEEIAFLLFFLALFRFLRLWSSTGGALMGVLFVGATMTLALRHHYFQPWSILEVALIALGLTAIVQGRRLALVLIVILASLNRETGFVLVLAYALAAPGRERTTRPSMGLGMTLFALWGLIFLGLRWALGWQANLHSVSELWAINTAPENLARTLLQVGLLLGPFWAFAAWGYSTAEKELRRLTWWVPAYLVTVLVWGIHHEARLWLPIVPVATALGLTYLARRGLFAPLSLPAPNASSSEEHRSVGV